MSKNNKDTQRKRVLLKVVIAVVLAIGVLALLSEVILPKVSQKVAESISENIEEAGTPTRIFYDESAITPEQLAGYDDCVKDIYFKKDGMESLVTDGKFYELGGNTAVMLAKYIEAVKNGDSVSYAECFSPKYDSEKGFDRFASGTEAFPPQRLYDIHIECLDERYFEESGTTLGLYSVSYRIYLNTGDFRSDIGDDTAPLIFTTEDDGESAKIIDISYRY
ncbi:MAG: hypothetical protein IKV97_03830 [Clostridia bacterium]|nr:hypothetical protein [Clostridia bacterium]